MKKTTFPALPANSTNPDIVDVRLFSTMMASNMLQAAEREELGWRDKHPAELSRRFLVASVEGRMVDAANYAMMLHFVQAPPETVWQAVNTLWGVKV